jgi:hypothetical protein
MATILEDRIDSLNLLKKQMQENIQIHEKNILDMKKKISALDEEIKILKDERTK